MFSAAPQATLFLLDSNCLPRYKFFLPKKVTKSKRSPALPISKPVTVRMEAENDFFKFKFKFNNTLSC